MTVYGQIRASFTPVARRYTVDWVLESYKFEDPELFVR